MSADDEDAEAQEGFVRGFHGIPSDEQLRSTPYMALCELLSSCQSGTTKHAVIEREKVRRDLIENARLARPKQSLWHHPLMRPVLYVVGVITAAAILVLIGFK